MGFNINFLAGQSFVIQDLAGSGLGFYGDSGFNASVKVGAWQGHTFITNAAGTTQGPEAANVKYLNAGSGILGQASSGVALTCCPNYQATLNVRATNDTPVQVVNGTLYIYDRNNINNPPSGVTCAVAQIIHPDNTQGNSGSGDHTWWFPQGSAITVPMAPSPGISGLYAGNGSNSTWTDKEHDWYFAISASPNTIGAKPFGLYVDVEYQ